MILSIGNPDSFLFEDVSFTSPWQYAKKVPPVTSIFAFVFKFPQFLVIGTYVILQSLWN